MLPSLSPSFGGVGWLWCLIVSLFNYLIKSVPIKNNNNEDVEVYPASILYKSTAGRYRPVRVADGPITARRRFIKNAYWVVNRL